MSVTAIDNAQCLAYFLNSFFVREPFVLPFVQWAGRHQIPVFRLISLVGIVPLFLRHEHLVCSSLLRCPPFNRSPESCPVASVVRIAARSLTVPAQTLFCHCCYLLFIVVNVNVVICGHQWSSVVARYFFLFNRSAAAALALFAYISATNCANSLNAPSNMGSVFIIPMMSSTLILVSNVIPCISRNFFIPELQAPVISLNSAADIVSSLVNSLQTVSSPCFLMYATLHFSTASSTVSPSPNASLLTAWNSSFCVPKMSHNFLTPYSPKCTSWMADDRYNFSL